MKNWKFNDNAFCERFRWSDVSWLKQKSLTSSLHNATWKHAATRLGIPKLDIINRDFSHSLTAFHWLLVSNQDDKTWHRLTNAKQKLCHSDPNVHNLSMISQGNHEIRNVCQFKTFYSYITAADSTSFYTLSKNIQYRFFKTIWGIDYLRMMSKCSPYYQLLYDTLLVWIYNLRSCFKHSTRCVFYFWNEK